MGAMYDVGCRVYCTAHRTAKRLLGRDAGPSVSFFHCYAEADVASFVSARHRWKEAGSPAINDSNSFPDSKGDLLWGENVVDSGDLHFPESHLASPAVKYGTPREAWLGFVESSVVPVGWANGGLHAVCWSRNLGQWALSSWVWTSAALTRYYASIGDATSLARVADALLALQLPEGGWIVRHDFVGGHTTPMIAPNDSAYIANNAMLCAYESLGDERYLRSAQRCASWIEATAQSDGLVWIGRNGFTGEWLKDANIVDIGFTAALFARLWDVTQNDRYLGFLERFAQAYVAAFRNPEDGSFATAIDRDRNRRGGRFARGQAWALEGLVPAARALSSDWIEAVATDVVDVLLARQMHDGGWAYNLSHPLMGQDCKGIPVIARVLAEWGESRGDERALKAAKAAIGWCCAHTALVGPGAGGIYSYCLEGCVTHHLYSEAAFTYASSYALETEAILARASSNVCRKEEN